jgi:predicted alpha-1,6-mannanase (GH76 family)
MYARAWDTKYFGGGLFWDTSKSSKNSCVNFPASIAAQRLYQATGNSKYLTEATNIYNWAKGYLWNPSTGQVYDNISTNGTVNGGATSYNQGTFVGAADYAGDTNSAYLVSTWTMKNMGSTNATSGNYILLAQYGLNNNNSGFNSICVRWMEKYFSDHANVQPIFYPWLQTNAQTAWNIRRTTDNLSWCQWHTNTPTGTTLSAWDCISSCAVLQAPPATQ